MRDAIVGLLDKVDAAMAGSVGVVPSEELERLAELRNHMDARLGYPDEALIAALAGGTGSGKSSLLNAIAGEEIAETGGIRPTTSEPLALVGSELAPMLGGYLTELGAEARTVPQALPWLCLLDLPDTDSVVVEHRYSVESLLPRVDLVIWVVDPEKYGDAALHARYIEPLIDYQAQFVFVLNQMDRVAARDRLALRDDFSRILRDSGVASPIVVVTSASPPAGPAEGVDRLVGVLHDARAGTSPGYKKLLTDLEAIAGGLIEKTQGAGGVKFEDRWRESVGEVAAAIAGGDSARGGHELGAFLENLGRDIGGSSGEMIRAKALEAPAVAEELSALIGHRPDPAPRRTGWFIKRSSDAVLSVDASPEMILTISEGLEAKVGGSLRETLTARARCHAAIVDLSLAVSDLVRRVS